MRNLPEWAMAFWGAASAGAVVVPLNAWWTGAELHYGLKDSGATVAFVDAGRLDRLRPHLDDLPDLKAVVVTHEDRREPSCRRAQRTSRAVAVSRWWHSPISSREPRPDRDLSRCHARPRGRLHDLLHLGYDGETQGCGRNPPQHVHQPDEPVLHQLPDVHAGQGEGQAPPRGPARTRTCSRCRSSMPRDATPCWWPIPWPATSS